MTEKTETEKVLGVADFIYRSQGSVNVPLASQMSGVPEMYVRNILQQNGFRQSGVPDDFLKD